MKSLLVFIQGIGILVALLGLYATLAMIGLLVGEIVL